MSERPILDAIRSLLKFKDHTTIAEIANIAAVPKKRVLEIVNANGPYVWRIKSNGHITRVDPQTPLREQLWTSGKYWRESTYGAWSVEGQSLDFNGNEDLKERLKIKRTVGALGDNYEVDIVLDTPDNRSAVEVAGLRPWSEAVIDDRLWKETA